MEFMGIGPLELLLILVVALIVFGPNRLPEIAAQLGKFVRKMREVSSELAREMNKELESSKKDVAEAAGEAREIARSANPFTEGDRKEDGAKAATVEPAVPEKTADSTPTSVR